VRWNEVKSILIIFFLITNIMLARILIVSENNLYKIKPEIIDYTVDILKQSNISIDKSVIPEKNPKLSETDAYNIIQDNNEFADMVLGGSAEPVGTGYISSVGTLQISYDTFNISYTDTNFFKASESPSETVKSVIRFLNISKRCKYYFDASDNGHKIHIGNLINKNYFFDSYIDITVTDDYISNISGVWFVSDDKTPSRAELKSVTGVLIDFMNMYKSDEPITITSLNVGYYIGESNVYHKSLSLIPVWQIKTSDGNKYYIDTRRTE